MSDHPSFNHEEMWGGHVAGVDEVGYGAWAGPVVVAAAILNRPQVPDHFLALLKDSKQLTEAQRQKVANLFWAQPGFGWASIAMAPVEDIFQKNVLRATLDAMVQAISTLTVAADHILVDGPRRLPCAIPQTCIIKGDQQSFSIALASILAKVTRDQWMVDLSAQYPGFGWEKNKGYGTAFHQQQILEKGMCDQHRKGYTIKALTPKLF